MTFLLYDRFFSLDEKTGILRTFWRVLGHNYNAIVQLHENCPAPTLNCFTQNIASLYIFCKPSQCADFERHHLIDIHKQHATNIKIFKYEKTLPVVSSSSVLSRNLDNIQNVFMMHTRDKSNIDAIEIKEPISIRTIYKIAFNVEKVRSEIIAKLKLYSLTSYPDIDMFVPFDDECELFLNTIFPTHRYITDSKYTYMTVVAAHYMDMVSIRETFYGIVQMVSARNISRNIMNVSCREPIRNPRIITDMFLQNVPIVDILVGRVYENEQCCEFHGPQNELTFIMIKIYAMNRVNFVTLLNMKYQTLPLEAAAVDDAEHKRINVIQCKNEVEMLNFFCNLYTNSLIFNTINMHVHFILATQRYKSNSYILLYRIIWRKLWPKFATHCIVSEDGKCVRFNRNTIILFDTLDDSAKFCTNFKYLDNGAIYLPELYGDSELPTESKLEDHIEHIPANKAIKYSEVRTLVQNNQTIQTFSLYNLVATIFHEEVAIPNTHYNLILESVIELSNKIRTPITLLYSLSVAQIAYRLIFYTSLRNGNFILLDRQDRLPHFYQTYDSSMTMQALNNVQIPSNMKIYQNNVADLAFDDGGGQQRFMFQNIVRKFMPPLMMGNIVDNYFNFFCPTGNQFPIVASLVDNEEELLNMKNAILWSRQRLFINQSIVSFDFSLYNSTLVALFDLDLNNCAILYGFELKTFLRNIYATRDIFENNTIKLLQLPYTFIMNNDTLRVHNIQTYDSLDELVDQQCYIVIMRFWNEHIFTKLNPNYKTLAQLFLENIKDINKYKTRLALHKNILNSVCGMLSSYDINTTILNIVNALSRKVILWLVDNCIKDDAFGVSLSPTSFLEHEYDVNGMPPSNLISIENDSFTFIYSTDRFKYDAIEENIGVVEFLREDILEKLAQQLTTCTMHTYEEIRQVINLKVNFITGNMYQISARNYYYLRRHDNGLFEFVSNEHSNTVVQKSLVYLNRNRKLVDQMRRGTQIKITHLKDTHNFPDTRRLLLWYMLKLRDGIDMNNGGHNEPGNILSNLNLLNTFIARDIFQESEIHQHVEYLFYVIRLTHITQYFSRIICNANVNLNFKIPSVPDKSLYEFISIPSDKKLMVHNCVDIFFKLYAKARSLKQTK